MKYNKIYGLILTISVLIFSGCGNDTKENPDAPDGSYSFVFATTPITVTQNGLTCSSCVEHGGIHDENGTTISVQLLKYGLVEPGQTVQMLPFDYRYGDLVNTVVTTDENGRAVFEYITPQGSDYDGIRGQSVTITAVFEEPLEDKEGFVDLDAPPVILLTQEFLLQFR